MVNEGIRCADSIGFSLYADKRWRVGVRRGPVRSISRSVYCNLRIGHSRRGIFEGGCGCGCLAIIVAIIALIFL